MNKLLTLYVSLAVFIPAFSRASAFAQTAVPDRVFVSLDCTGIGAVPRDHFRRSVPPANWAWVQAQCEDGKVLTDLQPVLYKVSGIVLPVFDNGQCFYETTVEPFKDRNPNGAAHEKALKALLSAAQKTKTPVYLGLDLFTWQKPKAGERVASAQGIFDKLPEWRELYAPERPHEPEALYASPMNPNVRAALLALVTEIATKFPQSSGVILNAHLSVEGPLICSEAARTAAMAAINLDPTKFDFDTNKMENSTSYHRILQWRREQIASLLKQAHAAYVAVNKTGQVAFNGSAGYYEEQIRSELTIAQDWRAWLKDGLADTVFLEGRWLPTYRDARYFSEFNKEADALGRASNRKASLFPVVSGSYFSGDSTYVAEWTALKKRVPTLNQAMFLARRDGDLQQILALAKGGE